MLLTSFVSLLSLQSTIATHYTLYPAKASMIDSDKEYELDCDELY